MTPHRVAGDLYYVGSRDLASFLITTPSGHILINSNLVISPNQIRASIEKLGFRYHDVKVLLISHAHYDHCSGSAQIKRETGAQYLVMDGDVPVVQSGGKQDFQYGNRPEMLYPPAKVDRVLHDGERVQFGGIELTANKTPGHTKGCTTWTMDISNDFEFQKAAESKEASSSGGKRAFSVVIVGSPNLNPGYNLIHDPKYPQMAADYAQCFHILRSLNCDIFLGAHGGYYNMLAKYARLKAGDAAAYFDPTGYRAYIADCQQAFETELARQQAAHQTKHSG